MKEKFAEAISFYQRNPVDFFENILGIDSLEEYHKNILNTVARHDRVAIKACHDVGKSWSMARIVLWYASVFPYCKIITTAPTFNQVKNILWSEIRSAHSRSKSPLGGRMNLTEWQLTPEGDWFALGFSPQNELTNGEGQGTASSFQGFHAPHIMIIFDEATGVKENIWTMAEGMLTSANVKFVAIANPTSRASQFFKCFSSRSWAKLSLTCFDSPNLIANNIKSLEDIEREVNYIKTLSDEDALKRLAEYVVVKPYLITARWVIEKAIEWGINHPLFISKVLGEFPEDSPDTLISLGSIENAQLRLYYPNESDRKTIGVDVARFGSDSTVLTALHGKKFLGKKVFQKLDTTKVTGEVLNWARELGYVDVIVVDETGLGSGVVDLLREAQRDDTLRRQCEVRGVKFGAACPDEEDKARFGNLKAKMFRLLSDDIKDANGITLPDESVYVDELPTIRYYYDSKGREWIESKDDYKKRTGRSSPDHSDSLALANFGRYDELTVGKFTEEYAQASTWAKPFAESFKGGRSW